MRRLRMERRRRKRQKMVVVARRSLKRTKMALAHSWMEPALRKMS